LTIEENGHFDGRFFVLDSMEDFAITHLQEMIASGITEVIFALTPSIANDAVILYIEDKLEDYDVLFTRIAQGVPTGVSLENIDMLSLARALDDRVRV
jgi:recombination protein RecR